MKLHVKLIRSTIKRVEKQKRIVLALGLRKMNQIKIHDDNPVIRGMIYKVRHLVEVVEIDDSCLNTTIISEVKPQPVVEQPMVSEPELPTSPVKKTRKKTEKNEATAANVVANEDNTNESAVVEVQTTVLAETEEEE